MEVCILVTMHYELLARVCTVGLLMHLRLNQYIFQEFGKCDRLGQGFWGLAMAEIGRYGGRWKALGELLVDGSPHSHCMLVH